MSGPRRGEVWAYLPGIAGRAKPSHIGADRVLIMSNDAVNSGPIEVAMGVPLVTGYRASYPTVVDVGHVDDVAAQALPYKIRPIPKMWLVTRLAVVDPAVVERVRDAIMECTSGGYPPFEDA
ncbi:type II toxin-antitoxin system PemK/MazF family toxin [Nocardia sp. NPDC059240]|uniref:type II toxin-antitoxin system PemK/MazF family toxin n=1 Tax=Nocardia sp. NPDC059240 TaxID=3346786 RepID=UPI0036B60E9E